MESSCRNEYDNFNVPARKCKFYIFRDNTLHSEYKKYSLDKVAKKGLMESERKNIYAITHTNLRLLGASVWLWHVRVNEGRKFIFLQTIL